MEQNKEQSQRFKRNFKLGEWRYHLTSFYLGYGIEVLEQLKHLPKSKSNPDNKFVIFTSGRSGSTLLVDLINSNPNIHCDDELLKRRVARPLSFIKLYEQQATQSTYGFKLLSYQLRSVQTGIKDKKAFFDQLLQTEGYKLIYLERKNKVKQVLSIIYGFYRGQWHNKSGKQQQAKQFELTPDVFYKFLDELSILHAFEKEMVAQQPHLYLCYEDHLQNKSLHQSTMQLFADYVGMDTFVPSTQLKKVTPNRLSDMISNKTALIERLYNTPYESYIPDLEKM